MFKIDYNTPIVKRRVVNQDHVEVFLTKQEYNALIINIIILV
jgi:hypothetical protein